MIIINEKEKKIMVELPFTEIEELNAIQKALIQLMRNYDFKSNLFDTETTFYYATHLLESLLPDFEQQENGLLPQTVIKEKSEC